MTVVASRVLARKAQPMIQAQRRTFLDWMVNYPDRINELKKVHQAGGRKIFTWQKQSTDNITSVMIPGALTVIGVSQCVVGFYRLATGTGKL